MRKKNVFVKKQSGFFRVTEKYEKLIRMFTNDDFKISDFKFPLSICTTLRHTLVEHEKISVKDRSQPCQITKT